MSVGAEAAGVEVTGVLEAFELSSPPKQAATSCALMIKAINLKMAMPRIVNEPRHHCPRRTADATPQCFSLP
jgi:hypothetical protein